MQKENNGFVVVIVVIIIIALAIFGYYMYTGNNETENNIIEDAENNVIEEDDTTDVTGYYSTSTSLVDDTEEILDDDKTMELSLKSDGSAEIGTADEVISGTYTNTKETVTFIETNGKGRTYEFTIKSDDKLIYNDYTLEKTDDSNLKYIK